MPPLSCRKAAEALTFFCSVAQRFQMQIQTLPFLAMEHGLETRSLVSEECCSNQVRDYGEGGVSYSLLLKFFYFVKTKLNFKKFNIHWGTKNEITL